VPGLLEEKPRAVVGDGRTRVPELALHAHDVDPCSMMSARGGASEVVLSHALDPGRTRDNRRVGVARARNERWLQAAVPPVDGVVLLASPTTSQMVRTTVPFVSRPWSQESKASSVVGLIEFAGLPLQSSETRCSTSGSQLWLRPFSALTMRS
jgi:hypothetical protein